MENNFYPDNLSASNKPIDDRCKKLSFKEDLKCKSPLEIASIVILVILLTAGIYFGIRYFIILEKANILSEQRDVSAKILNFENLFINKVLKSQGEVSYQDRLKLENAVASIGDSYITSQWQTFLASKTEAEAQQNVLNLLNTFVQRIPQ